MMSLPRSMTTYWAAAALALTAMSARADIYTLGDSLSDAGSLDITYTDPAAVNPLVAGRIWIQDLTTSTPAFCAQRSKCPWDPRTYYYGAGNNYAVGGAGVLFDSTDARTPNTYTSLGAQVASLIGSGKLREGDAVTVLMGANDIQAAAAKPQSAQAVVVNAAAAFVQYVTALAAQPTHPRVYVFTVPDLGQTPIGRSAADGGAFLSQLTQVFNGEITTGLRTTPGVSFIISSVIFGELAAQLPDYPIYCAKVIDLTHVCGSSSNPVTPSSTSLLFADPMHPSQVAHSMIAARLRNIIR
ncbi:SGNH/GDSL hydrolase family protein [Roseateles saccharophilus]|uniref:Phospholipase/lecithinase/hemolysin n=2 Tax=Roseateles saccharophilus TaxID=304 RepID=A0A4R3U8D8_ROSSA|nr:phospholipase/lecithinase/hemolysin [Roseateles saccharophilus]